MGVAGSRRRELLLAMFAAMSEALGPSGWWPASSPFEVMAGAVLTQNTSWTNVEKALRKLGEEGCLSPEAICALDEETLSGHIRASGFFRLKAKRLKALCDWLERECGHDLALLGRRETGEVRQSLLEVCGIGPETADSILLYALQMPVFVVDAYTRRIFSRHGLINDDMPYEELQDFFQDALEPDAELYNEFHALLVRVAKDWCKKGAPRCGDCPLRPFLDSHL